MLGTPYQTKLTFLANLLTFLRILLQWKLDYDISLCDSAPVEHVCASLPAECSVVGCCTWYAGIWVSCLSRWDPIGDFARRTSSSRFGASVSRKNHDLYIHVCAYMCMFSLFSLVATHDFYRVSLTGFPTSWPHSPAPHSPPPPPHSPQYHTRQHHTRQQHTHHTESSSAHFRCMHRCTSGRSCVQLELRADDPLDSCVGCIVLVSAACVRSGRTVRVDVLW
jgi:hypothetical protein